MELRGASALAGVVQGLLAAVVIVAAVLVTGGLAASDNAYGGNREDAVNAIIKSLAPIRGKAPGRLGVPDAAPRRVEPDVEGETIIVLPSWAVDIEVYFDFDQADLTPRAQAQLAALGAALASPELVPFRYLVAGHTDARGDDLHNLDLSLRRARAVRDYLIEAFPIDPHRLRVVGFGERRLKRPQTPFAAINRRVEVVLIAPPPAAAIGEPRPALEEAPPQPTPAEPMDSGTGIERDGTGQPRVRW